MDINVFKLCLFSVLVLVQVGCATTRQTTDDSNGDLEESQTHDDSHGWGANLQGSPH